MPDDETADYFLRRSASELKLAEAAEDPTAAARHFALAEYYTARAQGREVPSYIARRDEGA